MKKTFVFGLTALFLFFLSLNLHANGSQDRPDKSSALQTDKLNGRVDYFEGEVLLNGRQADFGDTVNSGDVLKTGEESLCDIVFGTGNIMKIGPGTDILIDWANSKAELKSGNFAAVMTRLDKFTAKDKPFEVTTASVAMGVRGTSFFIQIQEDGSTYVCTCNGSLELTSSRETFVSTAKRHKAYIFRKVDGEVRSESAGLLYHNDDQIIALAARIGYTIDWETLPGKGSAGY